jgi:hypothetical protein
MGLEAQEVPRRTQESKYDFPDADVKAAVKMLGEGKFPGQGGYEKEGHARSAAAHLIEQCEKIDGAPAEIGSRAWADEDGKWRFALKIGKRKPNTPKK